MRIDGGTAGKEQALLAGGEMLHRTFGTSFFLRQSVRKKAGNFTSHYSTQFTEYSA